MTIDDFRKTSLTNTDCELDGSLTKFEKALCRSLYRTEIIAKRGRIAPVIFPTQLKNNIDLLLKTRCLINNPGNSFLFPDANYLFTYQRTRLYKGIRKILWRRTA